MIVSAALTLVLLGPNAPAAWKPADCPAVLARSRKALGEIERSAAQHRVGRPELNLARLDVLEAKFDCRELGFEKYCAQARPLAVEAVNAALAAGSAIAPDLLLRCQLRNGRIQEMCRTP